MAKTKIKLPPPYIAKMKAVKAAKAVGDVTTTYGIRSATFYDVLKAESVSEIPLQAFNAFFANYEAAKSHLPPLDFHALLAQDMPVLNFGERAENEAIIIAHLEQTGDIWADIRALYLDRRNDDALSLARWGLHATDFQTRLASAQSLIYLNQRLGRLAAAARAVDALNRIVADNPKLFSIEQRLRTAADITKCLSENGHPRLAAPLWHQLTQLCDRYSYLIPDQVAASVFRGACECKFLSGDYIGARTTLDRAMRLAQSDTTLGTRLTHVNAIVLFSSDDQRESPTPTFDKAWRNLGEDLSNLHLPSPAKLEKLPSSDSAAPPELPLATLNAVLVTSALSGPKDALKTTWNLIDERADWLYKAGLADNKVLSCGVLSLPFAADILQPMPKDHPGRWIFESMVKPRLPRKYALPLSKSAADLLKEIS